MWEFTWNRCEIDNQNESQRDRITHDWAAYLLDKLLHQAERHKWMWKVATSFL